VGRGKIIFVTVGAVVAALVTESYLGSTRYQLNGVTYAVPHKYEFMRNFSLPWLAGVKGLDKEPDQSVWLLFPANQLAQGVHGYSRWFHGYSDQVEADMVVNVLGGKEAREFPGDRRDEMAKVEQELANKSPHQLDPTTGWQRVYSMVGEKGTPGEGGSLFYLIPPDGLAHLPPDWRVPSCQGSPDMNGKETYDCSFVIYRGGLTFDFSLRRENLGVANRIPDYVQARLNGWRT
jgi:hypothetical protein